VERSETERQTVLRETEEEAGLTDVKFIEGYRHPISYYYKRAGKTVYKEVVFYLLESKSDSVRLSREHVGYDWLPYDRAYERLTYKNAKESLRKANEYLGSMQAKVLVGDSEKGD
jgi:8-oxo-dGTP pyrophosphatase MutT (NUDIX family)